MRVAKWALIVFAGMLGILVTILILGFIYGLMQLGIAAVRAVGKRLSRGRGVSTPPGGTSCTK